MKKKLIALLMVVFSVVCLTACKKTTTKPVVTETYTVSYYAVGASGEVELFYSEVVERGAKVDKSVTVDGVEYLVGDFYTNSELAGDAYGFDAITADLDLYTTALDYVAQMDLVTGDGYTLNYAIGEFPNTWNNHVYSTNAENDILSYLSDGFYEFDYNEAKDGFVWIDSMAVGDPVDVTANYVGEEWGIEEGAKARAWKIELRSDLCWDDGTEINAHTFEESMKRLLNPNAMNSRADDYTYIGNLVIHNAKKYVYQLKGIVHDQFGANYKTVASAMAAAEAQGTVLSLNRTFVDKVLEEDWIGGDLATLMHPANHDTYITGYFAIFTDGELDEDGNPTRVPVVGEDGKIVTFFDKYNLLEDEDGMITVTPEMVEDYSNCDKWNPDPDAELGLLCSIPTEYHRMAYDKVGFKAVDDNHIVYILDQELSGFYLKYSLSSFLVKPDLYDACDNLGDITENDGVGFLPEGAVYNTTYCTSVATSASYGPYKLTQYQLDKTVRFEKNPNWWGFTSEEYKDLYQTTAVVYTKAVAASTRLQMFLTGKFDSYGLGSDDMAEYASSKYTYYTDGYSTWFIAFNPSQAKYKSGEDEINATKAENEVKIDKEMLSLEKFRMGISFALNRSDFILTCDPTGNVGLALFNNQIVSDPEKGTTYRTTEAAKKAMVAFWGLEDQYGPGKLYEDIDEAIDSITGYNLEMAKTFFNEAYDEAVELGYIAEDEVVEILIGTPNLTSETYNKAYDYLVNCYTQAVVGTKLEGKLTFKRDGTLGNKFGEALRNHKVDMLYFVGFSGSALDPYGLVDVYTTSDISYTADTDCTKLFAEVELPVAIVEGIESTETAVYKSDLASWTRTLSGNPINVVKVSDNSTHSVSLGTSVDYEVRGLVLAAIEVSVLKQYSMIPIDNDSSASLKGMKVNFYTEDYVYGVGRGGIKYMTFNYNDTQWAEFVKSQGGKLNYKVSAE